MAVILAQVLGWAVDIQIPMEEEVTLETNETPNPGSPEATNRGCTCPVIDNHYGKGVPAGKDGAPLFWHRAKCPLHGRDSKWKSERE